MNEVERFGNLAAGLETKGAIVRRVAELRNDYDDRIPEGRYNTDTHQGDISFEIAYIDKEMRVFLHDYSKGHDGRIYVDIPKEKGAEE